MQHRMRFCPGKKQQFLHHSGTIRLLDKKREYNGRFPSQGVVVNIFLFWYLSDVNIIVCYICICMFGGGYLLFDKVKKKEYCIFTYYFCLIHFILVIMFFLICCSVYHFILENQPLFNNSLVLKLSLIFAIFNGLLLPLLVPSFRLIWEVFRVKIKFKKDTKRYQMESVQKTIELNKYFQFLIQLRSL